MTYQVDLFSLTLFGLGSTGHDLLAAGHVAGIRCSLALDTAITIEMASSASLGRDTGFVGTGRVGTGLGFPVAMTAMEFLLHLASINHRKDGFKYETTEWPFVHASKAEGCRTGRARYNGIRSGMFQNAVDEFLIPNLSVRNLSQKLTVSLDKVT